MSDELKLRELLWLRHGCSIATLYGDDGNMQCPKCGIDFLHDSAASIESHLTKAVEDKCPICEGYGYLTDALDGKVGCAACASTGLS